MKLDEVRKYFRTITCLTTILGISRQAWYVWKKQGHVPIAQQIRIEKLTDGKLKVNINDTNYKQDRRR
jgi:DNA-binding transcriptional regulator Cro